MKKKTENEEKEIKEVHLVDPGLLEEKEIKVKKAKDFDFSVPVSVEETDEIGDLVLKLSEYTPTDMKRIYKAAKTLNKATFLVEVLRDNN